jgi:Golgi nucleoside diphosphatase
VKDQQPSPFDAMADALDTMVEAMYYAKSVNGNTARASSPAAWENTGGVRLQGDWSSNPVLDANLSAGLLANSASDHVQGLAAVLRMESSGIFPTYTVARGLVDAAARAWYLLEPRIDSRDESAAT